MVICLSPINNKQRREGRNATTDILEKTKIPRGSLPLFTANTGAVVNDCTTFGSLNRCFPERSKK